MVHHPPFGVVRRTFSRATRPAFFPLRAARDLAVHATAGDRATAYLETRRERLRRELDELG